MLGDSGVGKTALVSQFMTSEYMNTYDASLGKIGFSCSLRWLQMYTVYKMFRTELIQPYNSLQYYIYLIIFIGNVLYPVSANLI